MDDLIEALQIMRKYGNPDYPTICMHDTLIIAGIDPNDVSSEDIFRLNNLGFNIGNDDADPYFYSFKFGNA